MPSSQDLVLDPSAVASAVGRFVQALGARAADRLEATLFAQGGVARLFSLEDAVARAWPGDVAKELVWSREDLHGRGPELRFRAFDADGALLAQESYAVGALKSAEPARG
ncbi:hypothetical protein [Phenylobacterium sp.]|uniref:hypothetical protein n=1 Tax=Phenylobacterium sp. TaxID=1871053 RepID=UPI0035B258BC